MLISNKKLNKIKVQTQSGLYLGQIQGFELETDTGNIEKYYVKNRKLLGGLFEESLIISKTQIISFDETKMVVDDATVKSLAKEKKVLNHIEEINPIITSKEL